MCRTFMARMLMMMRRLSSISLVTLLLLQTLALNYVPEAEAASARGGSKGIPKKNIRKFKGKNLIKWSIYEEITSKIQ